MIKSILVPLSAIAFSASVGSANFVITGIKTDQGATDIVELYYRNDGVGGTGTALEAYQANYSGTPLQFRYLPGDPTDPENPGEVDIYNRPNNPSLSWFRVHPLRQRVFAAEPEVNSTAWASPIGTFSVTYATFELDPLPANTVTGVRFARLVLPDGGRFFLDTRVGGEVGPAVDADYDYFIANQAPTISGAGHLVSDAAVPGLRTHRVSAADADGLIESFSVTAPSPVLAAGFQIQQISPTDFDIQWNPALVARGDYSFSLVAQDSSIQSNSTFSTTLTISVVPEPSAGLLATAMLAARRRRR